MPVIRQGFNCELDEHLYDEIERATSAAFAFNYFMKAKVSGKRITPYTRIAWERILANQQAKAVLEIEGYALIEPYPFGDPRRPDSRRPTDTAPPSGGRRPPSDRRPTA